MPKIKIIRILFIINGFYDQEVQVVPIFMKFRILFQEVSAKIVPKY